MKFAWKENGTDTVESRIQRVQFICLLAVLLITLVFFLLEDRVSGVAYLLVERYMTLPAMAFLGASLCRTMPRSNRWMLYAGLGMIALFFVNQVLHRVLEAEAKHVGTFVCTYALCLPFAAATEDDHRQTGLKWMAGLFFAVALLLTVYTGLLILGMLPGCLQNHVYWDGNRLTAIGHPNICATLLMIGIALSAGFAFQSRKRWIRLLLTVLILLEFGAMSLTNGRTTIILSCLLLGGIVFCVLRGRGWKRLLPALLCALLVMAAAFIGSRFLFRWNEERLVANAQMQYESGAADAKQPDDVLLSDQRQGTLSNDMKTLNGRTTIWRSALAEMADNARLRLIGTEYVDMILTRYSFREIYHTHNSWLEALFRMGLPGLAAALVITGLAVWNIAVVLWRNTDLWKSCIALMMLCLMGCAVLEPYLFVSDVSYFYLDLLFMMCLGYMNLWRGQTLDRGGTAENV